MLRYDTQNGLENKFSMAIYLNSQNARQQSAAYA